MKRYIFLIISISLAVIALNFKPDTYLTGWDNLHPEFNLTLNIKRSLFAVWQEYQGLGLLGGMGHAADLFRQLTLIFLSLFFPQSLLRFISTSSMLVVGPLGIYFLLSVLLSSPGQNKKQIIYFCGALFYLFNLATVQIFFVPFEAFVFHYGFLPWLMWAAYSYLKYAQKKYLLYFTLISILGMTQSYVPTLFAVYLLALTGLFIGIYLKEGRKTIKKAIILFLITFLVNAFWLLPFSYFTLTSSSIVGNAHENFMATEDIYLRNNEFGNIADVALLKGFWFNFVDINAEGKFTYMVGTWNEHLSSPIITGIGYVLFSIVLLGLFNAIRRKDFFSYSLVFLFLIPFSMLANDTLPFSWLNHILRNTIPLFEQVFRVPFTKFAILASFSYSLLFAYGIHFFIEHAQRIWKYGKAVIFIFFFTLLIIFIYPMFQGNLFYSLNKLSIPDEYFELMNFFKSQNRYERIANFPQHTYWGWNHYQWGYRGSGFLWYGVEQPILDRAFDGYSSSSENYYWELQRAVYAGSKVQLENILEKYQITWLLIDRNIISLQSSKELQLSKLAGLLQQSHKVTLAERFGNIWVYKIVLKTKPENFVFLAKDLPSIAPTYQWNNYDQAYQDQGNYISTQSKEVDNKANDVYYPFRSLFTGRKQNELEFRVKDNGDYFSFYTHLPKTLAGSTLIIPELFQEEIEEIDSINFKENILKYPQIYIDNEIVLAPLTVSKDVSAKTSSRIPLPYIKTGDVEVRIPKINGYYHSENTLYFMDIKPKSCNPFNSGIFRHDKIYEASYAFLRLTSIDSNNCIEIDFPTLSTRLGYLMSIESRNIAGKSLLLYLNNTSTQHNDLQTYLPKIKEETTSYLVIPPMDNYDIGYKMHLDNISIGKEVTANDVGKVTVNQIPYRFLTSLRIKKNLRAQPISSTTIKDISVVHANPSHYEIRISPIDRLSYLVLSQSYDSGWKAYEIANGRWPASPNRGEQMANWAKQNFPFFFGKELKEHVLVNNWANGWILDDQRPKTKDQRLIIIFWPQYLEYLGFGILIATFLWLAYSNFKKPQGSEKQSQNTL